MTLQTDREQTTVAEREVLIPSSTRSVLVVLRYEIRKTLRNPAIALIGIGQPLLYLFLFGPLLVGVSEVGGQSESAAYRIFVPALFIQLALFGGAFVGISLVTEYRSGALERVFATPISRNAVLAGKVIRDTIVLTFEALIMTAASTLLGFRSRPERVLVCLGLVVLVSVAMSAVSYLLALTSKSEETLSNVFNALLLPVVLLAGVMLPMALAPSWLQTLSRFNPMTYIVDGARAVIAGKYTDGDLALGYGVAVLVAVVGFALAARAFHNHD